MYYFISLWQLCFTLQVGLDGIRMMDPSTSRTLRIYPFETVIRWEVRGFFNAQMVPLYSLYILLKKTCLHPLFRSWIHISLHLGQDARGPWTETHEVEIKQLYYHYHIGYCDSRKCAGWCCLSIICIWWISLVFTLFYIPKTITYGVLFNCWPIFTYNIW